MKCDLIKALETCLKFMPETTTPGISGVFFDFATDGTVELYVTDGHMMVQIVLVGMITTVTEETYYLPVAHVQEVIGALGSEADISIMPFGNDVMFMAGANVVTAHREEDRYGGKYRDFFGQTDVQDIVMIDFVRLQKALNICLPLMATFADSGPGFYVQIHKNKTNTEVNGNMAIITPGIAPGMTNIKSIKIVIMGMMA